MMFLFVRRVRPVALTVIVGSWHSSAVQRCPLLRRLVGESENVANGTNSTLLTQSGASRLRIAAPQTEPLSPFRWPQFLI
jgi:hypothetical protein